MRRTAAWSTITFALAGMATSPCFAQLSGGSTPPPSLQHELILILVSALTAGERGLALHPLPLYPRGCHIP